MLQDFKYVFSDEILGLLLNIDIEFRIDLVLGETPFSKAPYRMSTI